MIDDPVLEPLLAIARASFPAVFEPSRTDAELAAMSGLQTIPMVPAVQVTEDHPRQAEFVAALADDPVLGAFAEESPGAFIQTNIGQGWRLAASLVAAQIIGTAASEILAQTRPTASVDELLARTSAALRRFRRLVAGEGDTATQLIAFEGISLPAGTTIETPWGTLRQPGPLEKQISPWTATGPVGTRGPTVILESQIGLRYEVGEPSEDPAHDGLSEPEFQVGADFRDQIRRWEAAEGTEMGSGVGFASVRELGPLVQRFDELLFEHGGRFYETEIAVEVTRREEARSGSLPLP